MLKKKEMEENNKKAEERRHLSESVLIKPTVA
jgi:hypothetical protein